MDELTLPIPELVDVIPAEQADALIQAARRELAQLNDSLEVAVVAADAAERRSLSVGADSTLLGRAAEQVQRFIEEHRSAAEAELKELLDAASDQARARVEGARTEADRMTADARRLRDGALRSSPDDGVRPPATDGVAPPRFLDATVIDLDEAGPAHEPPGPPEPLWLPEAPAADAAADPVMPVADERVDRWWQGADTVEGDAEGSRDDPSTDIPASGPDTAAVPTIAPDPTPADDQLWVPTPTAALHAAPWLDPHPSSSAGPPDGEASPAGIADLEPGPVGAGPARLRLGSVPAFALLQVAALLVVLVVLLAFVG